MMENSIGMTPDGENAAFNGVLGGGLAARFFRRAAASIAVSFLAHFAFATPNFTIDSVLQRYPWSNTVDIRYTVSGLAEGEKADLTFNTKIDDGEAFPAAYATVNANGSHVQQLTPQPNTLSTNCMVYGVMTPTIAYVPGVYMIVDLETGEVLTTNATDSASATESPYNTDEYKTTKLVLRKIPAASGVHLQTNALSRTFNFSHDYYIGVFPVTEYQYKLLVKDGSGTSSGDTYPVASNSWEMIRGSQTNFNEIAGIDFATDSETSFIAKLNNLVKTKSGLDYAKFELPTEVAWEYAAGAGTSWTNAYFFGSTMFYGAGLGAYAWYDEFMCRTGTASATFPTGEARGRQPVGLKMPNQWGLYDVYGNVWEWVRDRAYNGQLTNEMPNSGFTANDTEPSTSYWKPMRRQRGGCYTSYISNASNPSPICSSVVRTQYKNYSDKNSNTYGFRIGWNVTP